VFGYLCPCFSEMKMKDAQIFREAYCGVCRAIRKRYGQLPRFLLTYDITVLALLALMAQDCAVSTEPHWCPIHPFGMKTAVGQSKTIDFFADMGMAMASWKYQDTKHDHEKSGYPGICFWRVRARCKRNLGEAYEAVAQILGELRANELALCGDIDVMADCFGRAMQTTVSYTPDVPAREQETLAWLAYQLGRWVYLADALDDLAADQENGQYNVLAYAEPLLGSTAVLAQEALTYARARAAEAFDLLPKGYGWGVAENVIEIAMPTCLESIKKGEYNGGKPMGSAWCSRKRI